LENANIARFRIDSAHSNAYSSAGRDIRSGQFPSAAETAKIRHAQELAVSAPMQSGVILASGGFQELVTIAPYVVMAYWITPYIQDRPADPIWIEARVEDSNVILRWRPNVEPYFYSYEVYSITAGSPEKLVSPMPLRSAMWVDTAPPPGTRSYVVRAGHKHCAAGLRQTHCHICCIRLIECCTLTQVNLSCRWCTRFEEDRYCRIGSILARSGAQHRT
jgi:hypothetical protein